MNRSNFITGRRTRTRRRNSLSYEDSPYSSDSGRSSPANSLHAAESPPSSPRGRFEESYNNHGTACLLAQSLCQNLQDLSLDNSEHSEAGSEWDLTEDAPFPPPATARTGRIQLRETPSAPCVFDDRSVILVEEDAEGEEYREWANQPFDFTIPFGPRIQWEYTYEDLHPHITQALNFTQNLPGMDRLAIVRDDLTARAQVVRANAASSYNDIAGRATHAARRTHELATLSGQVSAYLAGEAWMAGQGAAFRLRERWCPGMTMPLLRVPPLRWDMLETTREIVREGMASMPPHHSIVRRGRGRGI
ncbi:hypothetical protein FDECE_13502 [Fusarium decemcellulare]|nr:hypothetical protein FDECE_13502 [Fusarium decemcellulare]